MFVGESLRVQLLVWSWDNAVGYSKGKRFRLAVVDLDKAKDYPLNFVCLLPTKLFSSGNAPTAFARIFGEKSLDIARRLLSDALRSEGDDVVRSEIEKRLKLLEPESAREKTCVSCGKSFQANPKKRFKQRFCEDCLRKKFGSRR